MRYASSRKKSKESVEMTDYQQSNETGHETVSSEACCISQSRYIKSLSAYLFV